MAQPQGDTVITALVSTFSISLFTGLHEILVLLWAGGRSEQVGGVGWCG